MTAQVGSDRPEKPYPSYPLRAHPCGQWCKKHKGKTYYCGPWDDPQAALANWRLIEERLFIGAAPAPRPKDVDIRHLCNAYLTAKEQAVDNGDITRRHFNDCHKACERVIAFFGTEREVTSLGATDFGLFRASFPAHWSVATVKSSVAHTRMLFRWAYDCELIDRPVRFGPNFSSPPKRRERLERAKKPSKQFSAEEIWSLLHHADLQMKAMIWLGINAAFGNADCGRLRVPQIDEQMEWLAVPRNKTGVARECWLWPESLLAIREVIEAPKRPRSKEGTPSELVFVTRSGRPWYTDEESYDPIGIQFRKVKIAAGCHRTGVGFYSLRHTFETVAGNTADQVAVDYVMGHADQSMAAVYRQSIDPERVNRVCKHVRDWLMKGKPKKSTRRKSPK